MQMPRERVVATGLFVIKFNPDFLRTVERAMDQARIQLLQSMPIFGGIRTDILEFLLAFCPVAAVSTNEFFFQEHEDGDSLFVLEKGEAAVLKSWNGQDLLIQTLKAGDCFGEMAVIDHGHRSASVRATEDCTAIRIASADLYRVYGQDLKQFTLIQMNMGREVCRRLREANNRLFSAQMGAPEEIGSVFLA
jgi:CRP-like cAMP-binding protein